MQAKVTVIVPVWNAFPHVLRCLESIARHREGIDSVLVIDDASSEGELASALPQAVQHDPLFHFSRNASNLGFVRTCNNAFAQSAPHDVIILNSDTMVTYAWVKKLQEAAYTQEKIATVTPLSNNGDICSVPLFRKDNRLPLQLSHDEFAQIVEAASLRLRPEIPTCIGFCVYIRRACLDEIGGFAEGVFGRGYGEENDFSCRASAKGFAHLLDDATFIFHAGSMSFQAEAVMLREENTKALHARHPHYFHKIARFTNENPLWPLQARILDALVTRHNEGKPRVLHILHEGPHRPQNGVLGGTEYHVQDIMACASSCAHWSLIPVRGGYQLTAHIEADAQGSFGEDALQREYFLDATTYSLKDILSREYFDFLHIHHLRHLPLSELSEAARAHSRYAISFHDYVIGCPRFHLCTPQGTVCAGHECQSSCGFSASFIKSYREDARLLLRDASVRIVFSQSSVKYLEMIFGNEYTFACLPHGVRGGGQSRPSLVERARPTQESPLRVCFVGNITALKGAALIESVSKVKKLDNNISLEWHVLGKCFFSPSKNLHVHGAYERHDLQRHFHNIQPHVVAILSQCPETYSLILDEAWAAGIPCMVTPLGAPAERARETGAGWVLPELSFESCLKTLSLIAEDWEDYARKQKLARNAPLLSTVQEGAHYQELYQSMLSQESVHFGALNNFLQGLREERPRQLSLWERELRRLIYWLEYTLDALGLRAYLQRLLQKFVPSGLLTRLKMLR